MAVTAVDDHACTPLCSNNFESILDQEALSCPLVLPNTTTLPLLTTVTLDPEYWSFAVRDRAHLPGACSLCPRSLAWQLITCIWLGSSFKQVPGHCSLLFRSR